MRPDLGALPPAAADALTAALGAPLTGARPVGGGHAGAVTAHARLADGREVFVKACPDGHPQAGALRIEGWFGRRAPAGLPAPALLASVRAAGWRALAFGYVPGRPAGPGDLVACAALARRIAAVPVAPALASRLPPAAVVLADLTTGWARVAARPPHDLDPWARARLALLTDLERAWPALAAGDHLAHTDLHPGNVLITAATPARGTPRAFTGEGRDPATGTGPGGPPGGPGRAPGEVGDGAGDYGAGAGAGGGAGAGAGDYGARAGAGGGAGVGDDGARAGVGGGAGDPDRHGIAGGAGHGGRETAGGRPKAADAVAVDWTRPALGAPWIDEVLLRARLGLAPRPAGVPREAVAALVAGAAGHWTDGARSPAPAYAPELPAMRARSARAALSALRACLDGPEGPDDP